MRTRVPRLISGIGPFLLGVTAPGVLGDDGSAVRTVQAARLNIAERAACSSLVCCKQPTEDALRAVSAVGFKWVDLACRGFQRDQCRGGARPVS